MSRYRAPMTADDRSAILLSHRAPSFAYDDWPSGEPYKWEPAGRGSHADDNHDFHVDLGCGVGVKKGRIGIDHFAGPGVDIVMDLDTGVVHKIPCTDAPESGIFVTQALTGLPFHDSSIRSIVTHHCFEHIGDGFMTLMNECYRVLEPGALLRIIVPLFPSKSAVDDCDHRRYFMRESFVGFGGTPGETSQNCWLAGFSVPYTTARFDVGKPDMTPVEGDVWEQAREMRISLRANK